MIKRKYNIQGDDLVENIVLIVGLLAFVYFMQIRPQQKSKKEHENMLKALKKGDHIIAFGGLHGIIFSLTDDMITLEIASGVYVQINRASIDDVIFDNGKNAGAGSAGGELEEAEDNDNTEEDK